MTTDQRCEPRQRLAVPVRLADGTTGTTRDLSASGLYFATENGPLPGSLIDLELELEQPRGALRLHGRARVLRLEPLGQRTGVAAQMLESRLELAT